MTAGEPTTLRLEAWNVRLSHAELRLEALGCWEWAQRGMQEIEALTARAAASLAGSARAQQSESGASNEQDPSSLSDTTEVVMTGQLKEGLLWDLLQLFVQNGEEGALLIESGPQSGAIYVSGGAVRHASINESRGESAFRRLLILGEHGRFTFSRGVVTAEVSIDVPFQHLLMDAARFIDESSPIHVGTPEDS